MLSWEHRAVTDCLVRRSEIAEKDHTTGKVRKHAPKLKSDTSNLLK